MPLQPALHPDDWQIATGPLGSNGATLVAPCDDPDSVLFQFVGALTGTVAFEYSTDGGATFPFTLTVARTDIASPTLVTSQANPPTNSAWVANTPVGSTHIRARVSAYTSGSTTVTIFAGVRNFPLPGQPVTLGVGAQTIGNVGLVAGTNLIGAVTVNTKSSGGAGTTAKRNADGSGVVLKAGAGTIHSFLFTNTAAAARFVKFFTKATAPTLGTDIPALTVAIPAGQTIVFESTIGLNMSTGISMAITTGVSDTDAVLSATGEVVGFVAVA